MRRPGVTADDVEHAETLLRPAVQEDPDGARSRVMARLLEVMSWYPPTDAAPEVADAAMVRFVDQLAQRYPLWAVFDGLAAVERRARFRPTPGDMTTEIEGRAGRIMAACWGARNEIRRREEVEAWAARSRATPEQAREFKREIDRKLRGLTGRAEDGSAD